jgi:uncharacterized protein (TIGR04376 family)
MGLLDDLNQFLENRLEEFLRNNPHLELQALLEQLREQEKDTIRLILDLQNQEQQLQEDILRVAKEIQVWHDRASKARSVGRLDLAQAADTREVELLREGNQRWGQMQGCRDRIQQTRELQKQIQQRSAEVQVKVKAAQVQREATKESDRQGSQTPKPNWGETFNDRSSPSSSPNAAQLDAKFEKWEMELELEEMKRNLGR